MRWNGYIAHLSIVYGKSQPYLTVEEYKKKLNRKKN